MSLGKLLGPDPLATQEHLVSIDKIRSRLAGLLPEHATVRHALMLRPYVETPPLTYWDDTTVAEVLAHLEADPKRTHESLWEHSGRLHRGLTNLHRPRQTTNLQESYDHGRASELLTITNVFLPAYLQLAEHTLGNLLPAIWAVRKKGRVAGKFILKHALATLASRGPKSLTEGYDDDVRNGIAHGEVKITGLGFEFGAARPKTLSSHDVLRLYDDLTRSCTTLGLAIQLFWLRHPPAMPSKRAPLALAFLAAAAAVTRRGLEFRGAVESNTPLAGRQLHAALVVDTRSRNQMLLEACRVARELVDQGAYDYDRMLMEIDCGRTVSALVVLEPRVLRELISSDAPSTRLSEALVDTPLLWYDEPRVLTSLRAYCKIGRSALRKARTDYARSLEASGIITAKSLYRILTVHNLSVAGVARVEVRAQLTNPRHAHSRELVRKAIKSLVASGRRRWLRSRLGPLDEGIPWPKRPCHVFVHLYRLPGPKRWLQRDGWMGGNVVAVAERVWGKRDHILIKHAQEQIGAIRVRCEIDAAEAALALARMESTIREIRKSRGLEQDSGSAHD